MSHAEAAPDLFPGDFNCAQAVFSTYAPQLGLDRGLALRIASPFGGGMGRLGEVCGAVSGALLVIGLKHGQACADDEAREKAYALVNEFVRCFKARHGSILCRALLGEEISVPEGRQRARERNLFATVCTGYVRDAVEILGQIL